MIHQNYNIQRFCIFQYGPTIRSLCSTVCSGHFWKKSVHVKITLDMVQMIWTFDIFMTKLQNCKNNFVQNSATRGTMISNGLNMTIFRLLKIIVPLVSEFWTKLFLQFWSFVMKISKVQIIWTMSSVIF